MAIIGTGPAACYTAQALLRVPSCRVTFYDRLQVPGGLARFGVAPDHTGTRRIGEHFRSLFVHPRVTMKLGVDVGSDVSHEAVGRAHDRVVYAVGADTDRPLDIPGIDLPGSISARTLVGWYTGHPDVAADAIDLTGVRRVTVIGNGNVALDAARILTADPDRLVATDIAPHALAALRNSTVCEVVVAAITRCRRSLSSLSVGKVRGWVETRGALPYPPRRTCCGPTTCETLAHPGAPRPLGAHNG